MNLKRPRARQGNVWLSRVGRWHHRTDVNRRSRLLGRLDRMRKNRTFAAARAYCCKHGHDIIYDSTRDRDVCGNCDWAGPDGNAPSPF